MAYAEIILNSTSQSLDRPFLYEVPEGITTEAGDLVLVPFGNGNRSVQGFVVRVTQEIPHDTPPEFVSKIKPLKKVLSQGIFDQKGIELMDFMRREYLSGHLDALRLLIPKGELKGMTHKYRKILVPVTEPPSDRRNGAVYQKIYDFVQKELEKGGVIKAEAAAAGFSVSAVNTMLKHGYLALEERIDVRYSTRSYEETIKKTLNEEQAAAVNKIRGGSSGVYLLHGITGSGKTEVFLHLVSEMLKEGHDSVILVPEIALTPQMIERVKGRFGSNISVYHSRLSEGEKYDEWMRVREGRVKVAIGARSALFLPFQDLKLVVVDEEHEMSYKSETNPKYITRDTAEFMMKQRNGKVVLASATPSMEAFDRARRAEYTLVTLTQRAGKGQMPKVAIIDMRKELRLGNRSILSGKLQLEMKQSLDRGRQIILFLNRRGMSGFVSCRACGFVYKCPNCSVSLTKHHGGRLTCHHCGHSEYMREQCPACGSKLIKEFGIGTEKAEEEVRKMFPEARILRMDRDTTSRKESYEDIYNSFRKQEADILIGTQMVAKGLDFHGVDLVGILAADLSMNMPDFRAYEKTFQLITQVSGRAGRGDAGGLVILQTYQPDTYPVTLAAKADYLGFFEQEMAVRKALAYPPEGKLLSIVLSGTDETDLIKNIQKIGRQLNESVRQYANITVMGPGPCLISRLKGWYRQQLVLKGWIPQELALTIKELVYNEVRGKEIRVSIDVNPASMV